MSPFAINVIIKLHFECVLIAYENNNLSNCCLFYSYKTNNRVEIIRGKISRALFDLGLQVDVK